MLGAVPSVRGAAGFTISPAAITNDYQGKITLTITGLVSAASVIVERYADTNSNGILDPGEPVITRFTVTDGSQPLIGGVRNSNVPGDEDGVVNGQVRVELYPREFGLNGAYPSVFRISDPLGGFTPVTKPFTVAQKVRPQGIAGRATSATTGLPLANSVIALTPYSTSLDLLYTLTDANGNFFFYVPEDYYGIATFRPDVVSDANLAIAVPCNQFVTNNVAFTNGTVWIAGRVTDTATGQGIGGILVDGVSTNNFVAAGLTDTNGAYAFMVSTNNKWKLHPDKHALSHLGYLPPATRTPANVGSANVSNVNFSVPKANALVYGVVRDNHFNPVNFMEFYSDDDSGLYDPRGLSLPPNGTYSVGVLGGTNWTTAPLDFDMSSRGYAVGAFFPAFLPAGVATNISFTILRTNLTTLSSPARISGTQFQMLLSGMANGNYIIVESGNVAGTNWSTVLSTNAPCNSFYVVDSQATNSLRFYRAIVVP
jgi:hypothetical protein